VADGVAFKPVNALVSGMHAGQRRSRGREDLHHARRVAGRVAVGPP